MCLCVCVCVCVFVFECVWICFSVCLHVYGFVGVSGRFKLARARGRTGSRLPVRVCVYSCVFLREQ